MNPSRTSKKPHNFTLIAWILVFAVLVTGCSFPGEPTTPTSSATVPTTMPTGTPTVEPTLPSNPPTEAATTPPTLHKEEIFTKSIHDFGDLRVDNLDDQEKTNFIVYARGVKEITATEATNILVDFDPEILSYTFANPDDMLKSMEPGDVFFAPVSKEYPDGLTIKVKQINVSGDQVIILSDEVGLADLFEYVDIYMDVSLEQPSYDSSLLEEGSEIIIGNGESMHAYSGPRVHTLSTTTLHPEIQVRQALTVQSSIATLTGALSASIKKITVEYRFSRENLQLFCGVWTDTYYEYSITAQLSSSIEGSKKFPQVSVPVYGLIKLNINPTFYWNGHGNAVSTIKYTEAVQNGITADIATVGIDSDATSQWLQYGQVSGKLEEMDGHFTLGLNLDASLGVAMVGKVGASLDGSLTASAAIDESTETTPDEHADYIHTCDLCFKGDVSTAVAFDLGVGVNLIGNADKNKDQETDGYTFKKRVFEQSWTLRDFYISFLSGTSTFGWNKCPNILYEVLIRVYGKNGKYAEGAFVTAVRAENEEQIISSAVTNEKGEAVLYLADNTLQYIFAQGDNQGGRTEYTNRVLYGEYVKPIIKMRANNLNIEFYNSDTNSNLYPSGGKATEAYGDVYKFVTKHYPEAEYNNVYLLTNYASPTPWREQVPGDYYLYITIDPSFNDVWFTLYKVESNGYEWGTKIQQWWITDDISSSLLNSEIFPYIDAVMEADYGTTNP